MSRSVAAASVVACLVGCGDGAGAGDPAPKAGPRTDTNVAPAAPADAERGGGVTPACGEHAIELCKLGLACASDRDCGSQMCGTTGPSRGTCVSARSCTGGAGANLACNGGEDCCGTIAVPPGTFTSHDEASSTSSVVTVSRFRLDAFEITVGRLRAFFAATNGNVRASAPADDASAHPLVPGSGWRSSWNAQLPSSWSEIDVRLTTGCADGGNNAEWGAATWTSSPGANEDKPANCVDWYTLFAFCAWDGGRLPTDAEWSYVAASGDEGRAYPWGDELPSFETHRELLASSFLVGPHAKYTEGPEERLRGDGPKPIAPVGKKLARSKWGHADLAGNVMEMVLDTPGARPAVCSNCAPVAFPDAPMASGDARIARGGSWQGEPEGHGVKNAASRHVVPTSRTSSAIGGRCARKD